MDTGIVTKVVAVLKLICILMFAFCIVHFLNVVNLIQKLYRLCFGKPHYEIEPLQSRNISSKILLCHDRTECPG